ncbi:DNA processing protein [Aquimarina sp. EL_43]|uniref:DNA-processing protein DprA n=1 Tax=unclassified Aquimarina TaxID=2627091 RepID=UPI0018CB71EB|nr:MULTISPECIES: DNA-processing protein DprA [unclassified Aquimarina]MBG6131653.1 DNA processing protein [Aquimarina sp. EL_35]MBG6152114.1 DNA processing protein [Aquimarina sp. EL_32]MBG6169942.1 DNA processing protein [Aquimarina sp. EL_43]
MNIEKLLALLTLKKVTNLGDSSIKKLIREVGDAEGVLTEKTNNLLKIDGIGKMKIKDLHNPEYRRIAENELQFIQENNINCLVYDQQGYPERLKHCIDGPVVLFSSGNIDLEHKKILSIVGTRQVTRYGVRFCEELIETLAPVNPVIVSGFAYGVDITAQRAAVKHNLQTIGCLAHGLNQIYPKAHKRYVPQIEENGGFFTDFWSTDTFDRKNFLGRNRIIAGLSEATVVIESADKGGSLVTADIANSYNRDVFAVPGRAHDPLSKGCNMLIKTQRAHMLTGAADLMYMLNWKLDENEQPAVQKKLFVELDEQEKKIYNFLTDNGKELLDVIALQCQIPTFKTASVLLNMELKGVIKPLPGKLFEAV